MSAATLYLIGTLLTWTGWVALARAAYLALKLALRTDPHVRRGQLIGLAGSCAVSGLALIAASAIPATSRGTGEGWSIPLVWVLMPFTAWLAVASIVGLVLRLAQAWTALNTEERRQRLSAAAVWAVAGAGSFAAYRATDGEAEIFRGVVPIQPAAAVGLIALGVAAMVSMALTAKATRFRSAAKGVATHAALFVGSLVFGVPFLWLVVTSFKEDQDMVSKEGIIWIPRVQVTMPFDDPADPLFEASYRDRRVRARLDRRMADGGMMLEVVRPYSLQGIQFPAQAQDVRRVPKDAKVVTASLGKEPVRALVAQEMTDGRERLRILQPERLRGTEFLCLPGETKPVMATGLRTQNYIDSLEFLPPEANMGLTYVRNTLILVVMSLIGTLLSSALVAYAFSRMRFPGKGWLFAVLLSTMMLPGAVTMLPSFLIFRSLGWIDTLYPLWVPAFFASAFNVFLLRQFFMGIPMELEDAAKIDGCSYLRTFWQVMLPQIKPALAVIAIWTVMGSWNNFMGPLIYVSSPEHMPIAYAVQLFQSDRGGEPGLTMAFATMAMVPVLLLFFFAQKYFIEGVQLTGLGGK